MHGKIWLESKPGEGSTFHFTVQLAVQDAPAVAAVPVEPQELRGMHALIVDDNSTNRQLLSEMLARWGMRPTAMESGRAALQAIQIARTTGRPFPLILLDGQMPDMDGFEFAEQFKNERSPENVSIIMLTSAGHLGDAARCRELEFRPTWSSQSGNARCWTRSAARSEQNLRRSPSWSRPMLCAKAATGRGCCWSRTTP
jgi:CheY-like chemotaxis protein